MSRALEVMKRLLGRRHKDIYMMAKEYAEKRGLKVEDVMASALAAYIAADDEEAKAKIEEIITSREQRARQPNYDDFLAMFERMMNITVDAMVKVHRAGQELVKSSLINEIKSNIETVKEIQKMGSEGGKGSIDDLIANALIASFMQRMAIPAPPGAEPPSRGLRRRAGTGEVSELE